MNFVYCKLHSMLCYKWTFQSIFTLFIGITYPLSNNTNGLHSTGVLFQNIRTMVANQFKEAFAVHCRAYPCPLDHLSDRNTRHYGGLSPLSGELI